MRHATIMNACLCKNGWKIDLDGISRFSSLNWRNVIHSMSTKSANHEHMTFLGILWQGIRWSSRRHAQTEYRELRLL